MNKEIIEDYEQLLDVRRAADSGCRICYDGEVEELSTKLASEYSEKIREKIERWASSTVVLRFYDRAPARSYIQAKMLYRDGFYEAAIMVARSIAEMICYDRLDGILHPFGNAKAVERKNFRDLIKWLRTNDGAITQDVFDDLNAAYDLGNNYVHPKSGQDAKTDSLEALHLIGKGVFEIYGVKSFDEMIGATLRTAYSDFEDICGGTNFYIEGFIDPQAMLAFPGRHHRKHEQTDRDV